MSDAVEKEAAYSRQELRDMLVGVTGRETRLNALHGYLVAATRLIAEEGGPDTADHYLLATRFRCLGRGSRELGRAS